MGESSKKWLKPRRAVESREGESRNHIHHGRSAGTRHWGAGRRGRSQGHDLRKGGGGAGVGKPTEGSNSSCSQDKAKYFKRRRQFQIPGQRVLQTGRLGIYRSDVRGRPFRGATAQTLFTSVATFRMNPANKAQKSELWVYSLQNPEACRPCHGLARRCPIERQDT